MGAADTFPGLSSLVQTSLRGRDLGGGGWGNVASDCMSQATSQGPHCQSGRFLVFLGPMQVTCGDLSTGGRERRCLMKMVSCSAPERQGFRQTQTRAPRRQEGASARGK